jgi:3-dehydroquinate synthase
MDVIQQEIHVAFRYPVHFTTGVFTPSNRLVRELVRTPDAHTPARVVVVVDRGVVRAHPDLVASIDRYCLHHADSLALAAPVLILPGGEQVKNDPRHTEHLLEVMNAAGLCRHSYLIAVGGGAVLDVAGFAAATAHRGVRLIRVPTTVLAQDDSAVGVKNGVNAFGKKNYLGTFAPPFAVVNDFGFLSTLSDRDWRGGISEAVKAALIRDRSFFEFIEAHAAALVARDPAAMEQVVRRSAALHLRHIATGGDPFELGSSRPLDFGHWAAHKLEQVTHHRMRHGEAVAIGIALDSTYSYLSGFLPEPQWRRIIDVILALGLSVYTPTLSERLDTPADPACVLRGLADFQEHLGGRLTIMLLKAIGEPFDVNEIRSEVMIRSIDMLKTIEAGRAEPTAQKAS